MDDELKPTNSFRWLMPQKSIAGQPAPRLQQFWVVPQYDSNGNLDSDVGEWRDVPSQVGE